jgi:hypothetical protein
VRHQDLEALRAVFSRRRLAPYEAACHGDQMAALRLYAWNIQVSAAFHGLLSCLEIAMRNAMQDQLELHFGRVDWWVPAEQVLHWVDRDKLAKAEREIIRRGNVPTAETVLENLSLGFWVSLLGSGGQYQYETRLWRPILHRAFPGYRGPRKPIHRDFDYMRNFRNQVAHHAPVHHRHLSADHQSIFRLAGYISPVLPAWMALNDRVPQVLSGRTDICAGLMPTSF